MAQFVIDTATMGNNVIVAGVANKRIKVTSLVIVVAGAVTTQWLSGATALSGAMSFTTGGGYALALSPSIGLTKEAYLVTNTGDNLILALGGAVQVSGHGTWEFVTG